MIRGAGLVAFLVGCALGLPAQQAPSAPQTQSPTLVPPAPQPLIPRSHEDRERRYQALHRIILNVQVTDASHRPAAGLTQQDFTLLDNGRPQTLVSFRAVRGGDGIAPAHVVLMLDAVNNMPAEIAHDRKGIEQYLKQSPPQLAYPTSIGILTGSGVKIGQPSRDRATLALDLEIRTRNVPMFDCGSAVDEPEQVFTAADLRGMTGLEGVHPSEKIACLNRRFLLSIAALNRFARGQEDVPGRVILIWIGAGWPLLLNPEFHADTPELRQNFFDNLVQVSSALRQAQVTLDAAFSPDLLRRIELRSDHDNAFLDGIPGEEDVTASSLGLQVLAHQSGGQILLQGKSLAGEIAKCVDDAELYYALSFDSAPASGPGEYHSLKVTVNQPGLTVRTNTVYYAEQ